MSSIPKTLRKLIRAISSGRGFEREHDIAAAELADYRDVTVLRTPDRQQRDRLFIREMRHDDLLLPVNDTDGATVEVEIWSFPDPLRDPDDIRHQFPSPTMRAVEGEVVHSYHRPSHGPHTLHHHGLGVTPVNDGVGHTTFELEGDGYIYQFLAKNAGTYFYHCHRNTVLHFELGMYGLLIIDPPRPEGITGPEAPYADGGAGFVRRGREIVPYDVEGLWVFDDIDLRWHDDREDDGVLNHGHGAGLACPFALWDPDPANNPHLHRFEPDLFLISGVIADQADPLITHPGVAVNASPGETVLLRVLNAAYTKLRLRLPAALNAEVIAMDGKVLGGEEHMSYSQPFALAELDHVVELTTAQRWDLLVSQVPAGEWIVEAEYRHWISGEVLGRARTRLVVA
jgi:FtsP/CotA-like multicopper oxidase with cupredoxin domain